MAAASDDEDQQDEGVDDGEDFDGGDVFDDDAFSPPVASKPAPHVTPPPAAVCAQAGTSQAAQRLLKDLQSLLSSDPAKLGISATPNEQNIYQWTVKLFGFDGKLQQDLERYNTNYGIKHVELEMKFPSEYPFSPPFIRVVRPRFQFHTGHVCLPSP
eukprot:TRINITY_DN2204_c0_g1_i12.p1 TRINITY_DN2204_c0_g1~~TRINITY_DN2204_c0_g1_i12.p1  ORF type:complete len:157 (+),score=26.62 TRINITY_DN2204_c0_g1_i12:478-948(+)